MGTKVHFSCHNSNALIGAPELVCLPSGSWSSPPPFCESVLCPDITNITNDRLRVSIVSREVGGRALFSCPPGFVIRGSATESVCQSTGEWAQPLPRCEGSTKFLSKPSPVHRRPGLTWVVTIIGSPCRECYRSCLRAADQPAERIHSRRHDLQGQ